MLGEREAGRWRERTCLLESAPEVDASMLVTSVDVGRGEPLLNFHKSEKGIEKLFPVSAYRIKNPVHLRHVSAIVNRVASCHSTVDGVAGDR